MNEKYFVTDDLFNKVEGMSKAQILALFENASYTPSFYAGSLENGVSYLYTGIKPTDALLEAILNHGLGTHTLTDVELDAINANVFSVLFFDIKTIAAKSDGATFYLNVVGESVSTLSSSNRVVKNYTTANYVDQEINKIKEGEITAKIAQYASEDTSKGTIEERLNKLGFKEGTFTIVSGSALTNSIKKQGKLVWANFMSNNKTIIRVPNEFRPKENTWLNSCLLSSGFGFMVGEVLLKTDGKFYDSDNNEIEWGNTCSLALNSCWEIA